MAHPTSTAYDVVNELDSVTSTVAMSTPTDFVNVNDPPDVTAQKNT